MIRPPCRVDVVYLRARAEPHLDVILRLEAEPTVRVVADTEADEARLLYWLQRADVVDRLGEIVADAVDQIGEGCA